MPARKCGGGRQRCGFAQRIAAENDRRTMDYIAAHVDAFLGSQKTRLQRKPSAIDVRMGRIELLAPELAGLNFRQLKHAQQVRADGAACRYIGRKSSHHHESRRGCRRHDRLVGEVARTRGGAEQCRDIDNWDGVVHALFGDAWFRAAAVSIVLFSSLTFWGLGGCRNVKTLDFFVQYPEGLESNPWVPTSIPSFPMRRSRPRPASSSLVAASSAHSPRSRWPAAGFPWCSAKKATSPASNPAETGAGADRRAATSAKCP